MTMQTCDPLEARQWFKLRTATNWAGTIVGFCVAVFILQTLLPVFVADLIAISVAFCVFFFVLHKRAIGIDCPSCGKYIATNTPWICGFKGCRNEQIDDHPFIYRCQHCGAEPMAYKCHHCGELIYLSRDQQKLNYATRVNVAVDTERVPAHNHDEKRTKRNQDIELAELDIKKAKIKLDLKHARDALQKAQPTVKTPEEDLEAFMKEWTGDTDVADKWREMMKEKHKDNPVELARSLAIIDRWEQNRMKT